MARERLDQLDAKRLHELFVEVDEELAGRPEPIRVLVAGGAALAFRWNHRATFDVDLMSGAFPEDFRQAIIAVAERNNLEWHWVNDGGTVGSAALEPRPQALYVGRHLEVYSPDDRYLLAMKLFAARERDFQDAVRLSEETGLTSSEEMLQLIDDAYYHKVVPAEIANFIDAVALTVAQRNLHVQTDPDVHDDL